MLCTPPAILSSVTVGCRLEAGAKRARLADCIPNRHGDKRTAVFGFGLPNHRPDICVCSVSDFSLGCAGDSCGLHNLEHPHLDKPGKIRVALNTVR